MIHKKLLEFQKKGITLVKVGDNPYFSSKYVPLNEVLSKVKGILNEMDIVILQLPEEKGLRTKLVDLEDGSEVECFMPYVDATTPQKLGSNNTYNRRYSLVTLLCLEDADDDGNIASGKDIGKPKSKTVRSRRETNPHVAEFFEGTPAGGEED